MALQNTSIDTIKSRIEKGDLKPFDGYSQSEGFLSALSSYPRLKESLNDQLESNPAWVNKVDHHEIFFILNNSAWKRPREFSFEPKLRLSLIGVKEEPTISIDL